MGEQYYSWLEVPNLTRVPQPMFDNWFMDTVSKTPWRARATAIAVQTSARRVAGWMA